MVAPEKRVPINEHHSLRMVQFFGCSPMQNELEAIYDGVGDLPSLAGHTCDQLS